MKAFVLAGAMLIVLSGGRIIDIPAAGRDLTQREIDVAALHDSARAWGPQPVQGAALRIGDLDALSWSAGDTAVAHDVYLGTDENVVEFAGVLGPAGRNLFLGG